jgi:hypothetical protein
MVTQVPFVLAAFAELLATPLLLLLLHAAELCSSAMTTASCPVMKMCLKPHTVSCLDFMHVFTSPTSICAGLVACMLLVAVKRCEAGCHSAPV